MTEDWERKALEDASKYREKDHLWGPAVSWGHVSYRGHKRPAVSDGVDVMYLRKSGQGYIATEHVMRSYRPQVVVRR
jgi:hypothetical protein